MAGTEPVKEITPERKLERRVAGGKLAKEVLAGISIPAGADAHRFWEVIAAEAAARIAGVVVPDGPASRAMDETEAGRFAASKMPFGKFVGEELRDVPPDYLAFLTESEFAKKLPRYVRSSYFSGG